MIAEPYAPAALKLLQGSLESTDGVTWKLLQLYQESIREYFGQISLLLCVYEEDGFAYLDQLPLEDKDGNPHPLPRLQRQDQLNWYESLLGAMLREKLYHYEIHQLENSKLLLTKTQLRNLLLPFLAAEDCQEVKTIRRIDQAISRLTKLGFLRLSTDINTNTSVHYYEVRRILKARFSLDFLRVLLDELTKRGIDYEHTEPLSDLSDLSDEENDDEH